MSNGDGLSRHEMETVVSQFVEIPERACHANIATEKGKKAAEWSPDMQNASRPPVPTHRI
jgi:hypothetical protein